MGGADPGIATDRGARSRGGADRARPACDRAGVRLARAQRTWDGAELAGAGAVSAAAGGARARREAGLVDELERHVPGQERPAVEADAPAARKTGSVEVVKAGIEDGPGGRC